MSYGSCDQRSVLRANDGSRFCSHPHMPDGLGLSYIGLSLEQVMLVKAQKTADALWSAEQILRRQLQRAHFLDAVRAGVVASTFAPGRAVVGDSFRDGPASGGSTGLFAGCAQTPLCD